MEPSRPSKTSPPPLDEARVESEAAPAPVTAEAPPSEETAAAPRPGETDDELAALDADSDSHTSLSPPPLGEGRLGDGESSDVVEPQGGGADPGAPIEERPAPPSPDVSAVDPAAGLARVGNLPPAALLSSLGAVSTAVDRQATNEHERPAANTPPPPRPPSAPSPGQAP